MIQIRSTQLQGPTGLGHSTTVVAKLDKPVRSRTLAVEIAHTVKASAPADTSYLLVLIVGDLNALSFANAWKKLAQRDGVLRQFMNRLSRADVMAGRQEAVESTKASLIASGPST